MNISGSSALVTGGASGLGLATVRRLLDGGAHVTILDLPSSDGEELASKLGPRARFSPADVTDEASVRAAAEGADHPAPLRVLVHCAGRGGPLRVLDREGRAGSLDTFETVVRTNLVGTFNVLRLAAERMARAEPADGERGVVVLTASIAAFEGRKGQIHYAASKAGIAGMTLTAARDLASRLIRVVTIAPGTFDTAMLERLPQEVRDDLAAAIPHPRRLGQPDEFSMLADHIIRNPMLNGEIIRLDGALRMST